MGLGFIQNASFVAINGYFKLRKNLAVGLAMVGTGIGQTLMPHVVRYFLANYGFKDACILLASLSLHGVNITLGIFVNKKKEQVCYNRYDKILL